LTGEVLVEYYTDINKDLLVLWKSTRPTTVCISKGKQPRSVYGQK